MKAQTVFDLLRLPPAKWRGALDEFTVSERFDLVDALDMLIERATRLRGYTEAHACSMRHGSALRESNRLGNKIRDALGHVPYKMKF